MGTKRSEIKNHLQALAIRVLPLEDHEALGRRVWQISVFALSNYLLDIPVEVQMRALSGCWLDLFVGRAPLRIGE